MPGAPTTTLRVEHIMGMPIGIDVRDEDLDPAAVAHAFDWLRFVDATFSTYDPGSEISRINRGELAVADAHPDVRLVLARCEQLRKETDGYFDAWAPSPGEVDPSGLVKGWAVARAARILEALGGRTFSVNAGGDIVVRGRPDGRAGWRVGIQHPLVRDRLAAVVESDALAIATSGAYERGEHVVDPHSGHPPSGVLSVTVVGDDLATADAYATAAYAMGIAGPAWTAHLAGFEAMTILGDEAVVSTPGFPSARSAADRSA